MSTPPPRPAIRYRVTLAVVCGVLAFLGGDDLWVAFQNSAPHVRVQRLDAEPHQHWLRFEGARIDLAEAINTTGTLDVQGLLAPLYLEPGGPVQVLLETRDPERITWFKRYHFGPDNDTEKAAFLAQHREALKPATPVQGLRMRGLVARSNHRKLAQLARDGGLNLAPDALILVEGERPSPWRGLFFMAVALAGAVKVWTMGRSRATPS